MKAITLWQPWATLIAIGAKTYETRSWPTNYRGLIAIHAAKAMPPQVKCRLFDEPFYSVLHVAGLVNLCAYPSLDGEERLPKSAIVAVATLDKCIHVVNGWKPRVPHCPHEEAFGDFREGRYAWDLHSVRPLKMPIPCKGAQGLWDVPAELELKIRQEATW